MKSSTFCSGFMAAWSPGVLTLSSLDPSTGCCERGRLTRVLPGVYAAPEMAGTWQTRAQALALRYHDAVLLGSAAARLSFWPEAPLDSIEAAVRSALKP